MADGTVVELGNGTGVIGGVREWDGGLTGVPVWNAEEGVDCRQFKVERNRKEEEPSCRCGCDLGDMGRSGAAPVWRQMLDGASDLCARGRAQDAGTLPTWGAACCAPTSRSRRFVLW